MPTNTALDDYLAYCLGVLKSFPPGPIIEKATLKNKLIVPIRIQALTTTGALDTKNDHLVKPGEVQALGNLPSGTVFVATLYTTGSYVATVLLTQGVSKYSIDVVDLLPPNGIGLPLTPPPGKFSQAPAPAALVGTGQDPNSSNKVFTQEQGWIETEPPLVVAAFETVMRSVTESQGTEVGSATATEFATEIGGSLSATWAGVSATLSTSIRTSVQRTESINITSLSSTTTNTTFNNPTDVSTAYYFFQLQNTFRIWKDNGMKLKSTVYDELLPVVSMRVAQKSGAVAEQVALGRLGTSENVQK